MKDLQWIGVPDLNTCWYLFNIKSTRKRYEICPKLTKKDTRTMSIDVNSQLVGVALVSFF